MMAVNKELERQQGVIKQGQADMTAKLKAFDDSIASWAITEREAIAKAERAKKQLAIIAAKIGG